MSLVTGVDFIAPLPRDVMWTVRTRTDWLPHPLAMQSIGLVSDVCGVLHSS